LNPAPYTTLNYANYGFTLCGLWVETDSQPPPNRAWVETGYTQGFGGLNVTLLYWAEMLPGGAYYEYAVMQPGAQGVQHIYMIFYDDDDDQWVVLIDGQAVGESPLQPNPFANQINAGGEMNDAGNTLTRTNPFNLTYQDATGWSLWGGPNGVVGTAVDPPLNFQWLNAPTSGAVFTNGQLGEERPSAPAALRPPDKVVPRQVLAAVAGAQLDSARLDAIAARVATARGDAQAKIVHSEWTTHGAAQKARGGSRTASVADDRQVHVVRLNGRFESRLAPGEREARYAARLELEIDAATGDVLCIGTLPR